MGLCIKGVPIKLAPWQNAQFARTLGPVGKNGFFVVRNTFRVRSFRSLVTLFDLGLIRYI